MKEDLGVIRCFEVELSGRESDTLDQLIVPNGAFRPRVAPVTAVEREAAIRNFYCAAVILGFVDCDE